MGLLEKAEGSRVKGSLNKENKGEHKVVETDIDRLYREILMSGRIRIDKAASSIAITRERAEELAGLLHKKGIIQMHYPVIGHPEAFVKEQEQKKSHSAHHNKNEKRNLVLFAVASILLVIIIIILLKKYSYT